MTAERLVVIGASLGGLHAVGRLVGQLQPGPYAVALVQHRMRDPSQRLVGLLSSRTALTVCEAAAADPVKPGTLYIAPPDYHLLCDRHTFEIDVDVPVQAARPSIDVLFESAAQAWGPKLMAVLLTGSSDDGLLGLAAVTDRGGQIGVQCPSDAECPDAVRYAVRQLRAPSANAERLGQAIHAWGCLGVAPALR